jgi:hypothetical protein
VKRLEAFRFLAVFALCPMACLGCTTEDDSSATPDASAPSDVSVPSDASAPSDATDAAFSDVALGDAAPGDGALGDAAPGDVAPQDAAPGDAAPQDAAPGDAGFRTVVRINKGITAPTTWVHGNLYVVESAVPVSAALTIEPDTIVKFEAGASITINAKGSILADAAGAATPCVFTSIKDDATGGDTNGDGTASAPARGDWGYVLVRENGSVFNYCRFLYGGGNMPYDGTLVLDSDRSATITNCTFGHNQVGTVTDTRAAALNAGSAAAATVITGNTFFDNDIPLVISGTFSLDDSNVFAESAAPNAATNKYNGIFWGGSYTLSGDVSWTNTHVPYVILGNPLGIAAGSSLTLGDNVIVKFDKGQRIDVSGRLVANGTKGILFTSIRDDSAGGDTNGDATATAAAPGDWGYVGVSANATLLNHVRFSYGGSAKPYHATVEVTRDAAATITNCTFSRNAGGTPADNRAAALNVGGAGAATIVTGNVFFANAMPLVNNGLVNVDGSNVFHFAESAGATPLTNTYNGIFMDGVMHAVSGSVSWSNTEVPYVLYGVVLTVEAGGTLTLGNDVVVKVENGRIDLAGSLTQGTGGVFTSFKDDAHLGDTNGDATASAPVKGDWTGVDICQGGPCTWATWANILYATHP